MAELAADPIRRYTELTAALSGAAQDSQLTPNAIEAVIRSHPEDETSAVAYHVAANSPLILAEANPIVHRALKDKADPTAKATAVSKATAAATGANAEIELSDPVMLAPWIRLIFGLLLFLALGACIDRLAALAKASNPQESAVISLAILGGLALIGLLVLVMGYKSVTIKGGGPSASGSASKT
jgi:hypothetical protein